MLRAGKVLTFDEVEQLNDMEGVVQLATWLDAKVSCPTREAKRKLLHAFRLACKAERMEQAEDENSLVPLVWNLGGHRILYTLADEELLLSVLGKLRPKFEAMMRWYSNLAACKKKQMTMNTYFKKSGGSSSSSSSSSSAAEADS